VLGNFIVLLNPVSWALYWTIIRHAEKLRAAAAVAPAAATALESGSRPADADIELWWEEMLAVQLITTAVEALAGATGMLISGWGSQAATIVTPDDLWCVLPVNQRPAVSPCQ
jgi:hypothetical protein